MRSSLVELEEAGQHTTYKQRLRQCSPDQRKAAARRVARSRCSHMATKSV